MRNRATLAGVALSAVAALWLTYGYAGAQEVVEGNPNCADLGIPIELKVEPPATGATGHWRSSSTSLASSSTGT